MNRDLLHPILKHFQAHFFTFFPTLTHTDLQTILAGEGELLLLVLQQRCGYTQEQAKAMWNEFVLRHVDGQSTEAGSES